MDSEPDLVDDVQFEFDCLIWDDRGGRLAVDHADWHRRVTARLSAVSTSADRLAVLLGVALPLQGVAWQELALAKIAFGDLLEAMSASRPESWQVIIAVDVITIACIDIAEAGERQIASAIFERLLQVVNGRSVPASRPIFINVIERYAQRLNARLPPGFALHVEAD